MVLSDEAEAKILMNLGSLREGEALRQRLTTTLIRVLPANADISALSREHGRRLLAAELLAAIETPESADARDDLATRIHQPRRPVEYGERSRRRVPAVAPDDAAAESSLRSSRRSSRRQSSNHNRRADRRLAGSDADAEA
jgi:hypothetical protein